uniref:Uncharacterized protein n=1 Tax=Rousettus aegyptiacus TaxID=9407 RepID=A0A7J8E8Y2_ROUAE|nr:hypothetical protein HJG63_008256 [Rousettus aegyptiacus]
MRQRAATDKGGWHEAPARSQYEQTEVHAVPRERQNSDFHSRGTQSDRETNFTAAAPEAHRHQRPEPATHHEDANEILVRETLRRKPRVGGPSFHGTDRVSLLMFTNIKITHQTGVCPGPRTLLHSTRPSAVCQVVVTRPELGICTKPKKEKKIMLNERA